MTVYIVVKQDEKGYIADVFTTLQLASEYIGKYPYSAFTIDERVVKDKVDKDA